MNHKFKGFYLYCGIGGGVFGFQQAKEEYKGITGEIETICGIDVDPEACEDFQNITGARAVQMDLFDKEQYVAFHGKQPPEGWREVTHMDIREACRGQNPDIIFTSPPCKGFSGLLPEKSAKSEKYQALNQLVIRGLFLSLEAFRNDLPALILLENVPRITTRGADLLHQVRTLLMSYGYVFSESYHDCGVIGGLAQHRKRFLLIARNPKKIPWFVYQPPVQRVKAIGEVLEKLPMPDIESAGPMHKLPRLQWKTWVRLALIPAGGDWRDLEKECYANLYQILPWDEASSSITGANRPNNGAASVADPRIHYTPRSGAFKIVPWNNPANTVTAATKGVGSSNGVSAVADPRLPERNKRYPGLFKVIPWDEAASTIIGQTDLQCGALSVADNRVTKWKNGWKCTGAVGKVNKWDEPTDTVLGHSSARGNGASNISDPRIKCKPRAGTMGVMKWDEPSKTILGSGDIHAGAAAIADPRIPKENEQGIWVIVSLDGTWHRPLTTLELAVIQGLPTRFKNGQPLVLTGNSDARWRERIGNMVPVQAAQAIAETMLRAMLPALKNEIRMAGEEIWVQPEQEGTLKNIYIS